MRQRTESECASAPIGGARALTTQQDQSSAPSAHYPDTETGAALRLVQAELGAELIPDGAAVADRCDTCLKDAIACSSLLSGCCWQCTHGTDPNTHRITR